MRYLLFISCCWAVAGCSSAYKNLQRTEDQSAICVDRFKPVFTRALYQAQVNVTGKHLSGLLVIKTMPDSSIRMVFAGEAGFTFFDFEFRGKEFKVHSIIKQMNKKPVIKTLRKDFELVLMQHLDAPDAFTLSNDSLVYRVFPDGKDFYYYITNPVCSILHRMERGSRKKKVVEAMRYGNPFSIPDSIGIRHYNFNFDIGLKRLRDDLER